MEELWAQLKEVRNLHAENFPDGDVPVFVDWGEDRGKRAALQIFTNGKLSGTTENVDRELIEKEAYVCAEHVDGILQTAKRKSSISAFEKRENTAWTGSMKVMPAKGMTYLTRV